MKPAIKIYDRPYLENPVYKVEISNCTYFMQRESNGDFDLWYEVVKNIKNGIWEHKGNFVGFTKAEAIYHFDFITK